MSDRSIPLAKFRLGRIVSTPSALNHLTQEDILLALQRHQAGDWGDVDEHYSRENELSLKADRSATTVLLPEDC